MSEELIQSYIDRVSFKGDTDFAISELQRLLNAYESLKNSKVNVTGATGLKDITTGSKEAEAAIAALKKQNDALTESLGKQNAAIKENERNKTSSNKASKDAQKAAQQEAKTNADLTNDYKQLSLAYNDAALKAKNYALQLGSAHPLSVQAAKDAKVLGDKLKEVDASVGQNQRNVGNYTNSIVAAGQKAFGFIRTAANILPGLGLSGAFLAAFEALKYLSEELGIFNGKLNANKEAQKAVVETITDYNKAAGDAIATVEKVGFAFKEAKDGVISKDTALKIYNESLGDTLGKANSLAEAEDLYNKKAADYIRAMGLRAQANTLFAKSGEALAKGITADQEDQTGLLDKLNASLNQYVGDYAGAYIKLAEADKKGVEKAKQNAKELSDAFRIEAEKLQKEADALSTKSGLNFDKGSKDKKVADVKQSTKEIFDAEFEDRKRRLQRQIQDDSEILSNEKNFYIDRLIALEKFTQDSSELAIIEAEKEKNALQKKQKELQANLKTAKGTEYNNIKAELENNKQLQLDIESKLSDGLLKIQKDSSAKLLKIKEDEKNKTAKVNKDANDFILAAFQDQQEEKKAALDKAYLQDTQDLADAFTNNLITEKEYNESRKRLDLGYQADKLQLEINFAKKIIELKKIQGVDVSKEEQKLYELQVKLNDLRVANTKKTQADIAAEYVKTFQTIKDVGEKVFGLVEGLLNANLIATKNALREQQDAAEKKAARDIDIVNASTATEEQKAARIAIINARLQAQKDQIAQRERQAELAKAKAEKAFGIFQITINTAIAVSKALASGNVFEAIAAGALGAAQLAIAIATPIPKFKHGKGAGNNYEGLAIVDDGGRAEAIQRADGSIEVGSNKPRLTYVGKNDIVHPSADAFMKSAFGVAHNGSIVAQPVQVKQENEVAREMRKQNALLKEIAGKPVQQIRTTERGLESVIRYGVNEARYLEDNCNWKRL